MKNKIIEAKLEAKLFGIKANGQRIWLDTELTIKYDDGTIEVKRFDRGYEAQKYLCDLYRKQNAKDRLFCE